MRERGLVIHWQSEAGDSLTIKDGKAASEVLATGVRTPNVFGIIPK